MTVPMPIIEDIRRLDSAGMSGRQIARELGVSRDSVAKYARMEDFSPELVPAGSGPVTGVLGGHTGFIDQILTGDKKAPRKQRHTAKRIYVRLVDECGYTGSYRTVAKYVAQWKQARQAQESSFAELVWQPGCAQVDFGKVRVLDGWGHVVDMSMLVVSFPFSNSRFAQLYQGENAECVCHGLQTIFTDLGFTPHTIVFDNATGIGRRVGKIISESSLFTAFRTHHRFTSRFCNPYSGHEKGSVENAVGFIRRNLLVPVPQIVDIEAFNTDLLARCHDLGGQDHYRKDHPIARLLTDDQSEGLPLPRVAFTPARFESRVADREGRVKIGGTYYLVDPALHGVRITVGIHHDHIEFFTPTGKPVRILPRDYTHSAITISDPGTLLSLVATRPGAWKQSPVRTRMPDALVVWIDTTDYDTKRRALQQLDQTIATGCDFDEVMNAATRLIDRGDGIEQGALTLLAKRVDSTHQPNPAVNLAIYDHLADLTTREHTA